MYSARIYQAILDTSRSAPSGRYRTYRSTEGMAGPLTRMRATLSRLALWRKLHPPLSAGWLAGRFPHALRAGTFRQQRDYFL